MLILDNVRSYFLSKKVDIKDILVNELLGAYTFKNDKSLKLVLTWNSNIKRQVNRQLKKHFRTLYKNEMHKTHQKTYKQKCLSKMRNFQ